MPGFLADALTWPHNYAHMLAVQTAMSLHIPPSVMMSNTRQPSDGWTPADKKLAMAWTILEKETCKQCGQPLWICRSDNKNLVFGIRTDICYAKSELEKWQDSNKAKHLKKGEAPYIVPKMLDNAPLPTRRAYIEMINEE